MNQRTKKVKKALEDARASCFGEQYAWLINAQDPAVKEKLEKLSEEAEAYQRMMEELEEL